MAAPRTPVVSTVVTGDGSPTLLRVESGWTYRSIAGAATESDHVFIGGTALTSRPGPWRVFEFGLGAGTNFVRTCAAREPGQPLVYAAVDREPLDAGALACHPAWAADLLVEAMLKGRAHHDGIALTCTIDAFDRARPEGVFDAVYFDPFGPQEEPESWSVAAFKVAHRAMAPDARLATYSAAGWVRRNMAAAGLYVGTLPNVGHKREFSVAARDAAVLSGIKIRNRPREQSA